MAKWKEKKSGTIVDKDVGSAAVALVKFTPKKASTKEAQAVIDGFKDGKGGEEQ